MSVNFVQGRKIAVQVLGDTPCVNLVGFTVPWSDCLTDQVSLLPRRGNDGKIETGVILSFRNARTLFEFSSPEGVFPRLWKARSYVLYPAGLPEEEKLDKCLYKSETIDKTGWFFEGTRFQTTGNLKEAIEAYDKALLATPDLPRVSFLKGLCLRLSGFLAEAEQSYLREIEISPNLPDSYCNLGILYLKTNRPGLARTMFEKSLERNPLFLNGILQFSKFLLETEGLESRLLFSLNQLLLLLYFDVPMVQDYLSSIIRKKGTESFEYGERLRHEGGVFTNDAILKLMADLDNLRFNGAILETMSEFKNILSRVQMGTQMGNYILQWTGRRISLMDGMIPEFLKTKFESIRAEINQNWPEILPHVGKKQSSWPQKQAKLTPEEFFEILLRHVLCDGQIKPEESRLVSRVKNALKIDEETSQRIFRQVDRLCRSNSFLDTGKEFSPKELYKQLIFAVLRDGVVEPSEKKLLEVAREALEILPEEARALMAGFRENELPK